MLVFMEGGKPEYLEKNPQDKDENQPQTQPTYDTGTGNRTRATLVEGECSHHCTIPAPLNSAQIREIRVGGVGGGGVSGLGNLGEGGVWRYRKSGGKGGSKTLAIRQGCVDFLWNNPMLESVDEILKCDHSNESY